MGWLFAIWNYTVQQWHDGCYFVHIWGKRGGIYCSAAQAGEGIFWPCCHQCTETRRALLLLLSRIHLQFHTFISTLIRNSLDMRSHGHWLLTDFWILLIYRISLVPSAVSQKWVISGIGTMRGCSAFGVIASGQGWFLPSPYCPRGLELPHIRADCRMCQQLVPHVF